MVAGPLEFVSSIKWRPPLLELRRERRDSLPDENAGIPSPTKQENGPSSRDEEGEPRLFLSCGGTLGVPLECRRGCWGTS